MTGDGVKTFFSIMVSNVATVYQLGRRQLLLSMIFVLSLLF